MSETTITADSSFEAVQSPDFNKPWTLQTDGTFKELPIKLHQHATSQCLRTDVEGARFRKAIYEANQRTIDAKKKLAARKSAPLQYRQPSTRGKPCNCGSKKGLGVLPRVRSKSSTATHQETQQSSPSPSLPSNEQSLV